MLAILEGATKIVFPQKVELVLRNNLLKVLPVQAVPLSRKLQYDHRGKNFDSV